MVRIETTGTFAEPSGGGPEDIGQGSGFIVDPSGIVVTNSHVVTGAETVTVWVGNELTKQTAKVLGVSECSDLAVIRLDGRADLPYLGWYEEPIESRLPIQVAGYPLGDTEPKVTPGAIAEALGRTDEARLSVDDTFQLEANLPVGFSGGPVVTDEGQVVAVNYPLDDKGKQPFAIGRDEARPILDVLQGSRDASVGINAYAQTSDPAGVWVIAVKPESLAAKAGILPGDVVTDLAGTSIAADGSLAGYCDLLGDYKGNGALPFTVFREESRAILEGAFNGDRVQPDFAFADSVGVAESAPRSTIVYEPFQGNTGTLAVEAPTAWSERENWAWFFDGSKAGPGLRISSDLDGFKEGYETPGTFVGASATLAETTSLEAVLDAQHRVRESKGCKLAGRDVFARGGYEGIFDLWESCDGTTGQFLTIAAEKTDGSHVVHFQFQAPDAADLAVLDRMLVTLEFDPDGL